MKIKPSQTLLIVAIAIFGGGVAMKTESAAASKNPQTLASGNMAPEQQSFTLKELIAASPDGQSIECAKVLPTSSQYVCEAGDFLPAPQKDGSTALLVTTKKEGRSEGRIYLETEPDPALLERRVRSQKLVMSLDRSQVTVPESWAVGRDYLVTVSATTRYSRQTLDEEISDTRGRITYLPPPDLLKAFNQVHYLHSKGIVGLNFDFEVSSDTGELHDLKLGQLNCAVRLHEPVGKYPFDPTVTDPVVLGSDGTLQADIAMDYYALGIRYLQRTVIINPRDFKTKDPKLVDQLKEQGVVTFPEGSFVGTALAISFLIQNDRVARSDTSKVQLIIECAAFLYASSHLKTPLTYNPNTDPLQIPEFKTYFEEASAFKARLDAPRPGILWGRVAWAVAGLALLIGTIVFTVKCLRRKKGEEVTTELQETTQQDPHVVIAH